MLLISVSIKLREDQLARARTGSGCERRIDSAYAGKQGLKVKDLYQWKTQLIKLGFYQASDTSLGFVPVKSVVPVVSNAASSLSQCALVFPSGLRFEFHGEVSPGVIREVMISASEPG